MTFISLRRVAFPRLAPNTVAFRATFKIMKTASFIIDVVALRNGRAASAVSFVGTPSAYPPCRAGASRKDRRRTDGGNDARDADPAWLPAVRSG
jgi:hypothetical protein